MKPPKKLETKPAINMCGAEVPVNKSLTRLPNARPIQPGIPKRIPNTDYNALAGRIGAEGISLMFASVTIATAYSAARTTINTKSTVVHFRRKMDVPIYITSHMKKIEKTYVLVYTSHFSVATVGFGKREEGKRHDTL